MAFNTANFEKLCMSNAKNRIRLKNGISIIGSMPLAGIAQQQHQHR
jgi:hypothetical protein